MWGFLLIFINMKESVGIVIVARETNNFLLLHRVNKPVVWSTLTGKMDKKGETPLETVKREIFEEIGVNPNKIENIKEIGVTKNGHHIMIGFVDSEFKIPNLKIDENDDYGWFNENNLPSPMHSKWPETFQYVKNFLHLRETIEKALKNLINERKRYT